MGVWLSQLIVSHVFADKIMDIEQLVPFFQILCWTCQLLHAGLQCSLVSLDFLLLEEILWNQLDTVRMFIITVFICCRVKHLRMVQTQQKIDLAEVFVVQARYLD